jgi:hypothetical protein
MFFPALIFSSSLTTGYIGKDRPGLQKCPSRECLKLMDSFRSNEGQATDGMR